MSEPAINLPEAPDFALLRHERLRVLVADDSPEFLIVASEFFKTNPNLETVGMASNGEDAVRLARKLAPDLVLVDSNMTVTNGADTTLALKQIHPAPRVVVVGGRNDPKFQSRPDSTGADAYLLKADFLNHFDPLVSRLFSNAESESRIAFSEGLGERTRRLNRDATVVLIDDDHVTQQLVDFLLSNAGYQVHRAGTGRHGLELVKKHRPDLVMLDVGLPDVSGIEICRLIKSDPQLRNTLIMHLSATHTSEADMARGLESGADAYFTLPLQKEQLLARVDALVRISRLETALKSNNAFFENLFSKSKLGVAYTTPQGRLLSVNEPLARLLHLENWQIADRNLTEFATLESRPAVQKALKRLQTAEVPVHHSDARLERTDGTKFWARLTVFPQHDTDGQLANLILLFEDITPQKQANDIRNAMLESIPASIAMLDREGRIIASNKAWSAQFASLELTGRSTSNGGNFFDYCAAAEDAADTRLANGLRRVLRDEASRFELEYSHGEGLKRRRFRLIATAMEEELDGAALVTHMDITEQHQLEARIRQSQKMDALGQLAGGVAHDFNNLHMVIRCNAEMLTRPALRPQTQANCVKDIQSATERADDLTRQLLAFSRQQAMEPVELNLAETIRNFGNIAHRMLGETIHVDYDAADHLPRMHGDPAMIDQLLINLAANASDAMPQGGTLTLRVAAVSRIPPADAELSDQKRWLQISMKDTGCGIPGDLHDKIFEPCFTTKEPRNGAGMGLASVHGIVKQHRGWIEVESKPGAGSCFRVHLPVPTAPIESLSRSIDRRPG